MKPSMPIWFLRQRLIPYIARPPKLIHLPQGPECIGCQKTIVAGSPRHWVFAAYGEDKYRCQECHTKFLAASTSQWHCSVPSVYRGENRVEVEGNLPNHMYRYWVGNEDRNSKYGLCRCCREHCIDEIERSKHSSKYGCYKILEACYKELFQLGFCIVCSNWTVKSHWGAPLCKDECKRRFMFDSLRWPKLEAALNARRSSLVRVTPL